MRETSRTRARSFIRHAGPIPRASQHSARSQRINADALAHGFAAAGPPHGASPQGLPTGASFASDAPFHHQLLELGDGLGRIEALRARLRAIEDGVAAVEPEWILKIVEPLAGCLVTAVDHPAVSL